MLTQLKRLIIAPWFISIIFMLVNAAVAFVALPRLGYRVTSGDPWQLALRGEWPQPAFYSPLPTALSRLWQMAFGTSDVSAFALKASAYGMALWLLWQIGRILAADARVRALAVYLTLFAPYLTWSVYVAGDVHFDLLGVALVMYFAARLHVGDVRRWLWVALGLSAALATSVREPNVVLLPALLALWLARRCISGRQAALALLTLGVALLPLLAWNYHATGTATLSARLGVNLYYGNHPNYSWGHPIYDIDIFLAQRAEAERVARFGRTADIIAQNDHYRQMAFDAIRQQPDAALQRALAKALWWVGPQRIPNTDLIAYLLVDEDAIAVYGEPVPAKDLLYTAQRGLVLLLVLLGWRMSGSFRRDATLLLLPVVALLPVVMATFPDTRFRLAYDPYTHLLAAVAVGQWLKQRLAER